MTSRKIKINAVTPYQILFWYDIPLQVRAGTRRERTRVELSKRFQVAVDNAAMLADLTGSDAYLEAFSWSSPQEREGSPQEVAEAVAREIEAQYSIIDWRSTAQQIKQRETKSHE